ncbi:MAG: MarR family transcriptional regulator, partial [Chloroflexi bacterium]|nr:MarR family transcriptional regulator [Chloroflexota bacterium]
MDTEAIVSSALGQLGLVAQSSPQGMAFIDLVIDPGGADVSVALKRRSLVTDDVARKLLAEHPPEGLALLVVGDRVTERARNLLRAEGTGFYDLRGHIAFRRGPMVIDADVEPIGERSARSDALSGKAGLEVATELLLHPRKPAAIRQIARDLHRSPSTISDIVGALRRDGLIDHEGTATDGRLFWLVADRWTKPRTYLARLPGSETPAEAGDPLSLGLRNVADASGWALTGTTAAAAYGAPVAARSGQAVEFFVPERTTIRR